MKDKHIVGYLFTYNFENVIDGISNETTLNKLAIKIGNGLMMEERTFIQRYKARRIQQSKQKIIRKKHSTKCNRYQYKHKVWVYCMNKHNLEFDDWTKEQRLHLGVKMLDYLAKLGLIKIQTENK